MYQERERDSSMTATTDKSIVSLYDNIKLLQTESGQVYDIKVALYIKFTN